MKFQTVTCSNLSHISDVRDRLHAGGSTFITHLTALCSIPLTLSPIQEAACFGIIGASTRLHACGIALEQVLGWVTWVVGVWGGQCAIQVEQHTTGKCIQRQEDELGVGAKGKGASELYGLTGGVGVVMELSCKHQQLVDIHPGGHQARRHAVQRSHAVQQ